MIAIGLIILGILSRIFPHPENFTAVGAVALFSGVYLKKKTSFLIPLSIMVISDFLIGLYEPTVILFNWLGFMLMTILARFLKKHKSVLNVVGYSLFSSFIYYLISNFGVWLAGWYPRDIGGLISCYIMGLPFLRNFTLSTIFYSILFFGIYELVSFLIRDRALLKRVLLTDL